MRKRLPVRVKNPLVTPMVPNESWSLDFVSDRLESGRQFRVLNILDDFNREAVAQEISMSMPAQRVIKALEKTIWIKGKPAAIRTDNTKQGQKAVEQLLPTVRCFAASAIVASQKNRLFPNRTNLKNRIFLFVSIP